MSRADEAVPPASTATPAATGADLRPEPVAPSGDGDRSASAEASTTATAAQQATGAAAAPPQTGANAGPPTERPLTRRRSRRLLTVVSNPLIVVPFLIVVVALTYFLPRKHAFVISAETKSVIVSVTNQTWSQWRIPEAKLCEVRSTPAATAPVGNGPVRYVPPVPCGEDGYTVQDVVNLELTWPVGTKLTITRNAKSSPLVVTVTDVGTDGPARVEAIARDNILTVTDVELTKGTRIVVPNSVWRRMGPLTFAGTATIGILPSAGSNDELLSGRYQILEELTFNDSPVKVKEDVFVPGDQVEVVRSDGEQVPGRGFVSNVALPSGSGLLVVLTTPTVFSELVIERVGATRARQTADWTDRALNDPSVLAIASLLGLVLATVEFLSKIGTSRRNGRD